MHSLKRKAFRQLDIIRKQTKLKCLKVDAYFHKKLVLKAFFGLLKFVESTKKRQHSQNRQKNKQTQKPNDTTPLGLVKVVPVIDKQVDEAYPPQQLISVQSLPDVIVGSTERCLNQDGIQDEKHTDFGQNMNLTFKNGFSFTGALLSAKKKAIHGSTTSIECVPSDYLSKQVASMGYANSSQKS